VPVARPTRTPARRDCGELRSLATAPFPGSLDEYAEWLATRLVSVVNMMAPELAVLGDLFAALSPRLVDQLRNLVQERSMVSRAAGGSRIKTSARPRRHASRGAEVAFESVPGSV
jgi:predicted NBD/HSP70 family sugar kinase